MRGDKHIDRFEEQISGLIELISERLDIGELTDYRRSELTLVSLMVVSARCLDDMVKEMETARGKGFKIGELTGLDRIKEIKVFAQNFRKEAKELEYKKEDDVKIGGCKG